jgi:hypothetical protein
MLYLPDDSMGAIAFHPAATFRREGMAKYASQLNALRKLEGLDKAAEIPISKCPLTIEQIEQVTAAVRFEARTVNGKDEGRLMFLSPTIRTVNPFDWMSFIRSCWPNAVIKHEAGKEYVKIQYPKLGRSPCFYIPDSRTLVGVEEEVILRLIRRAAPAAPAFARGEDWKKVEHDLVAIVLDNSDGRITRATTMKHPAHDADEEEKQFEPLLYSPNRWVIGLADADEFLLSFLATCRDTTSAADTAKLIAKVRDYYLRDAATPTADPNPEVLQMQKHFITLLHDLRIETAERTVAARFGKKIGIAEMLPLIAKNGL